MKLSLGTILAICLAGLQFLAITTFVIVSYISTERVLLTHARALLSDLGTNTILQSKSFLDPARSTALLAKRLAENDIVASDNPNDLEQLLFQQLQLAPQFEGVYLGDEQGTFVYVARVDGPAPYRTKIVQIIDGMPQTQLIWRDKDFALVDSAIDLDERYDPRARPWYINAKDKTDIAWTDPYIFFSSKEPGITAASAVIGRDGQLAGVVGVDIAISSISKFLTQLRIGETGTAMILNKNGDLIAHPNMDLIKIKAPDGRLKIANIDQIADPIAKTAFSAVSDQDIPSELQSSFKYNGQNYLSTIIPTVSQDIPWRIALYAPEDDFIGGIKRNRARNVWIAGLVALITGLAGVMLAKYINQPMRDFAKSTRRMLQGDVSDTPALRNRYPELQSASETLRTQVEQRKRFEQEFGDTFDLATRGMAQIDPETGRFIRVNKLLSQKLGYSDADLLNLRLFDLLHPDDTATATTLFLKDTHDIKEHQFVCKNGDPVWLRINTLMIRDHLGAPLHAVATLDDVTSLKRSQAKINDLNRDLSHFARVGMMGQLASGLAHELNQPLTAITQNADAALTTLRAQETFDPELETILNALDTQAHRSADIIRALRGFVAKDHGANKAFAFNELVDQSFSLVQPEARQHKVTLRSDTQLCPPVFGNRIQIAQVLVNLLRNAIYAIGKTHADTRLITVTTTVQDRHLLVSVDDTGGGIDPNIDLFKQFETSKPDGMGLGLTFSRDIMQAAGGDLWFSNDASGPSRFCFTIPLQPTPIQQDAPK